MKPQQAAFNDQKHGNFAPTSNISNFLLSKGSSGSLGTNENDYSYRINLDGMSGGMHHNGQFSQGGVKHPAA